MLFNMLFGATEQFHSKVDFMVSVSSGFLLRVQRSTLFNLYCYYY